MSTLDRIDDEFAKQHGVLRVLIPRFEPANGNEYARFLFVLERPGPKSLATKEAGGPGVISQYNNDASARTLKDQLALSGLDKRDICLTNIVPHVRSSRAKVTREQVTPDEIRIGFDRLLKVVDAMPRLEAVILLGKKAQKVSTNLRALRPSIQVLELFHTSAQTSGGGRKYESTKHHMWRHNIELMRGLNDS